MLAGVESNFMLLTTPTYHMLTVCIQTQNGISKLRVVFSQTQIHNITSLVTLVISIQHL